MKSILVFCFLIVLLELTHSHRIEPDEVFAEIWNYGKKRLGGLRVMRGNKNLAHCLETYRAKVTELAKRGENQSENMIDITEILQELQLQKDQEQRSLLDRQVQNQVKSLNSCTDGFIEYLTCLKNRATVQRTARKHLTISDEIDKFIYDTTQEIGSELIATHLQIAKDDIDSALNVFKNCLTKNSE